ncbi:MAG TPA: hypothetical protein GX746_01870 [Bacteroidales bacterium]|nr:hypothetical protein [Bacteroidales bacterium]
MMDIDNLLNKYFEGDTSLEEERMLSTYFNQEDLPEHLKELTPMFTYIEDERVALEALEEIKGVSPAPTPTIKRKPMLGRSLYISAVAAASIIALFFLFSPGKSDSNGSESYAWINGKRITDKEDVKMFAEKSLENVSSNENIFIEQMSAIFEETIGEK